MNTLEFSPLRDALRCDRLLRALGRRIPPGAIIQTSDQNIFEQSIELVRALIRHDPCLLPFALEAIERLQAVGFQRQHPDECFFYLLNCLTALRLDMPLPDEYFYEFILFFSEFQRALQNESDREFAGFVSSSST